MTAPFVWYDVSIAAERSDHVRAFYSDLLDWPIAPADDGPYPGRITDGEQPWAAIVAGAEGTTGSWIPFARVADLDAATARARGLGCTVVQEATDGPAGRAVAIADPGAIVSLWVPYAEPSDG